MEMVAMNDNYNEILTIVDLAGYLRIPKSTLYRLAQEGKVPGHKVGRHWRFRKEAIDRWLDVANTAELASLGNHVRIGKTSQVNGNM